MERWGAWADLKQQTKHRPGQDVVSVVQVKIRMPCFKVLTRQKGRQTRRERLKWWNQLACEEGYRIGRWLTPSGLAPGTK